MRRSEALVAASIFALALCASFGCRSSCDGCPDGKCPACPNCPKVEPTPPAKPDEKRPHRRPHRDGEADYVPAFSAN